MLRLEKLDVWQKAVALVDRVYAVTKSFPDDERFGLTSQMRRAAVAISSTIAEGSGRSSDKDSAHFMEIAYGSLMEVVWQAQLGVHQSFLKAESRVALSQHAEELARMPSGLRSSRLRREPSSGS